jgi:hypothetical protein
MSDPQNNIRTASVTQKMNARHSMSRTFNDMNNIIKTKAIVASEGDVEEK